MMVLSYDNDTEDENHNGNYGNGTLAQVHTENF